jgi:lipopolysaccharide export LptBFGC system permease protein LptF
MIMQIRWLRVVGAALLVEVGLMAMVPLIPLLGEETVFKVVVPVACVVVPFVVAFLATRALPSARVLNAVLIGIVATAMYFALVIGASSIAEASASYGVPLFLGVNALRIISAAAGGYAADRRAVASAA